MESDRRSYLKGMVVAVTGVTGFGLGRALFELLAAEGACVVGNGRRVDDGTALATQAGGAGQQGIFLPGDVSRIEDCEALIQAATDRFGRIDVLINNAGVVGAPPLVPSHEVEEGWWDRVLDINLKGAFFCARFALARMVEQEHGLIINVASRRGVVPGPQMAAYAASKAGLIHLSASLAEEYRLTGIRVNAVILGGVVGETSQAVGQALATTSTADERATLTAASSGGISTGLREARSVAAAITTLLDPRGTLITGAAIHLG